MHSLQPALPYLPAVRRWLSLCIALVALMVCVGGVTRLTESGLSIVEWKLLSGTLPPMSDSAWQAEFAQYKTSPQYQKVNSGFTVEDFKQIFWLEYLHRLLGRIIGMVIVGGTIFFGVRRYLPRPLLKRMLLVSLLTGAQGTVGWIMVASGLVDAPRVAPVKLALHLCLAFSLYMALLWTRWQVIGSPREHVGNRFALAARAVFALAVVQIVFGALVAGLRAGLTYNTYPLMDGQFIPGGLHLLTPWWKNHLESVLTVQFQHRMGAIAVVVAVISLVAYGWRQPALRPVLTALLTLISLQFLLGVATLLSVVNLWLASAHQLVALFFIGLLTRVMYRSPIHT